MGGLRRFLHHRPARRPSPECTVSWEWSSSSGQVALAESHLRSALEIAANASCPLIQADSAKELAGLYQAQERRAEALDLLRLAQELYRELKARVDLAEVKERIAAIQG